jgi:thiol-disulfide isomerase/thioredoxin
MQSTQNEIGALTMRLTFAISIGFGLLALTACSKTHQPVANNAQSTGESHATSSGHSTNDEHNHGGDDAGQGHERHGEHGSHTDADVDQHVSGVLHGGKQSARDSRHHGHGSHKHPVEHHAGLESTHIAIGDKVPDFEFSIDGEKLTLSDLQKNTSITEDGTLVLTFWCSFCHSCRHVEHGLDTLAKQYQGQVGIIAVDSSAGETTEGVAEFAKQRELTLPIALDATGAAANIFGVRVTTTTVVIDKSGVLRYRGQFGDEDHAFAHEALRAVLAGEDVPVLETRQKG